MKPYFSIIMPNYNHGHFIKESIQSILNQDFDNWELIIVDNNSSDNSKYVIQSFKDLRIKLFTIENHGVLAKSRNLGIKMSTGKWIAFLDSDDLFESNKLSEIYKLTLNKKDGIFYHSCYKIIDNKKTKKKIGAFKASNKSLSRLLMYGNRIVLSSIVLNKTHLNRSFFSEEKKLVTVEDFDLIIKLLKNRTPLNLIYKTLGSYRISSSSLSQKKNHFENTITILEREKFYVTKREQKNIDIYILYCKIKGKIVSPLEGFKILIRHNIFSNILLKSYIINSIYLFEVIKKYFK